MARKPKLPKTIETLTHDEATRKNIPTAEYQSVMDKQTQSPVKVTYPRGVSGLAEEKQARNPDLDPQLIWRGKDQQDESDLVVNAPPLYIQEKVHPKVLIDDLRRRTEAGKSAQPGTMDDLFADFNGLPDDVTKTEFYQHDANWTNRMILGDSLQVMASLAEREGLRGKVQCIYLDPPYGIKFNSNFQWSTTSRDVKDGKAEHITREPEQVKAFRDTWRDGIHSYLTYLRDRLTVARDLLTDSGSIFVQIGDENVHRVRAIMDEVFGAENFVSLITFSKTTAQASARLANVSDYIVWYSRSITTAKFRQLYFPKEVGGQGTGEYVWLRLIDEEERPLTRAERNGETSIPTNCRVFRQDSMVSQGSGSADPTVHVFGKLHHPGANSHWKTHVAGVMSLAKADRVLSSGRVLKYKRFIDDFAIFPLVNNWCDTGTGGSSSDPRVYVVQTVSKVIERCLLMATDPGDLVLDPTCGSGTTATVAEQWGRRWITIDTSRVALALARARIMGARYPYYLLADSPEGQRKEAEITHTAPSTKPTYGNVRQGFVYERVPHITLKSIANNAEIDVIWDKWQQTLEPLREHLNQAIRQDSQDGQDAESQANDPANLVNPVNEHESRVLGEAGRQDSRDGQDVGSQANNPVNLVHPVNEHESRVLGKAGRQDSRDGQDVGSQANNPVNLVHPVNEHESRVLGKAGRQDLRDGQDRKQNKRPVDSHPVEKGFLEEWEVPRERPSDWPQATQPLITAFWQARIARQKKIDASIAAKADSEYLYDKPYTDKKKVRVAGPFTVESLSPHRVLGVDENDELIDGVGESGQGYGDERDFVRIILENLKTAGVQQAHKDDKIIFTSLTPWPGDLICAEGRFRQDESDLPDKDQNRSVSHPVNLVEKAAEKRAAIFIGPEFGTVSRPDLVAAAREAGDADFDVLITCAFNYDAMSSEFDKLGRIPVLKARMNADLHMAEDLKNTGKGNLFVIFGEPDIDILDAGPEGEKNQIRVKVNGVDVFHPNTGEVRSDGPEGIACWFIDTDYNEESFFVRHAYFLGANDPYKALKTTLKAEINEDAWATLHSDTSCAFVKPKSGRIAVKVINHLGDEVMKVFRVESLQ